MITTALKDGVPSLKNDGELCLVLTRTGSHDALFGRGGKNF